MGPTKRECSPKKENPISFNDAYCIRQNAENTRLFVDISDPIEHLPQQYAT